MRALLSLALGLSLFPALTFAAITPFGERVNQSVESGLAWLRSQQGSWGDATGLAVLCFLEKRTSADWNAQSRGYLGMDAADQELVRGGVRHCINSIPGFDGGTPSSYETGSCLMAMSLYLVTGGPDDVGANRVVSQAIANGVGALKATQGNSGTNRGGWNYTTPDSNGDLSTTQFAMAGLSAAASVRPDADDTLAAAQTFITNAKNDDGGHKYRSGSAYQSTSSMTASGIWTYRLSGLPTGEPRVQSALAWLRDNYRYDSIVQINGWASQYYYLWAAAKALEVTAADDSGAFLFADAIGGVRNPAADGFPEESPRWYYDFAWYLVTTQNGNGQWCTQAACWNNISATSYSILVLERSLGGVCIIDDDGDDLCSTDDNCPEIPNPDQQDTDADNVGDVCDNCIGIPNRDQVDIDGDGMGDACDPYNCVPDSPDDMCDGRDNDCDGQVDEGPAGGGLPYTPGTCATGERGSCAAGDRACIDGQVMCIPRRQPMAEICDGYDNNCDGVIDEGLVNTCGRCEVLPQEICNCEDDDCDGEVDEGELCPGGGGCVDCACRPPCQGNECVDAGTFCNAELNLCVEPCVGVECGFGLMCEPTRNTCIDPCQDVVCPAGQRCWEGACIVDDCVVIGCAPGSICNGVECVPDPCAAAQCEAGQFCRGGQCVPTCAQVSCALFETCVDGRCVADPCGGLSCPDGQRCSEGQCAADPCASVVCGENQTCRDGQCAFDDCTNIDCPVGQNCELRNGVPQCVAGWVPEPEDPVTEDGGVPPADGGAPTDAGPRWDSGTCDGSCVDSDGPNLDLPDAGGGVVEPVEEAAAACACDLSDTRGGPASLLLLLVAALGLRRRTR